MWNQRPDQTQNRYIRLLLPLVALTTAIGQSFKEFIEQVSGSPFSLPLILADMMPSATHFYWELSRKPSASRLTITLAMAQLMKMVTPEPHNHGNVDIEHPWQHYVHCKVTIPVCRFTKHGVFKTWSFTARKSHGWRSCPLPKLQVSWLRGSQMPTSRRTAVVIFHEAFSKNDNKDIHIFNRLSSWKLK